GPPGSAPHRGAPEPDRTGAQRRFDGMHRRRARDWLGAAAADAIGQSEDPGRAARLFRSGKRRRAAREADAARPLDGRYSRRRQPAYSPRPPEYRQSLGCAERTHGKSGPRRYQVLRRSGKIVPPALERRNGALGKTGRTAEGNATGRLSQEPYV